MHWPEARFYLRRVRIGASHPTVAPLRAAGFDVQPAAEDPARKVVVAFPVDAGAGVRTLDDVTMWEQLALAALLQRHWADNQVSCTVTFNPATEARQIAHALDYYQFQLKGVSFLPRTPAGAYAQMPYEAIDEARYRAEVRRIATPDFAALDAARAPAGAKAQLVHQPPDAFCDNDTCR
jgi:hypothetical protein